MGVIGERELQELVDKAEWEITQGTPRDIASRGIFDACAEALEYNVTLADRIVELEKEQKEAMDEAETLRDLVNDLVDVGIDDEEDLDVLIGKIFDGVKAYAAKMDEKICEERAKTTKAENRLEEARARIEELERAGGPEMRERITYLEKGLQRLMSEAFKIRQGVL